MAKREPKPDEAVNVKFWAEAELIAWLDREAEKRDRSRGYLLNEAIRQRMERLERGRQRSKRGRAPVDAGSEGRAHGIEPGKITGTNQ